MHAFGRCWLDLMDGDVEEAVVGLHGVRLADGQRRWNGAEKDATVVIFCRSSLADIWEFIPLTQFSYSPSLLP